MKLSIALLAGVFVASCSGGDSSSLSPTAPSAPPPPAALVALTGTVTVTNTTVRLAGATVQIADGLNAGRSTTTTEDGTYRFADLQPANGNVSVTAPGWTTAAAGTYINGTNTLNFTIQTIAPYARVGGGNTVFDKPLWVTRLRITGQYTANSSNFIVWCGTSLLVNELLGTGWGRTSYDGTHAAPSCREMRVENSTGVAWTFTEAR